MSKFTLSITASPATLAAILSNLPADALVNDAPTVVHNITGAISPEAVAAAINPVMPEVQGNAPSIPTGTGTPVVPASPPLSVPTMAAPTPPVPFPSMPAISTDEDDEPGQVATGDTDSTGLRWDERIHAGTKTQNKDGSWKKRKGVDPALVATVEAELRGAPAQPPAMTPIPMPTALPIPSMPANPTPEPIPQPVAAPAPMPAPVAPAPAPAADGPIDMMGLMSKIAQLSQAGTINAEYIAGLVSRMAQGSGEAIGQITEIAGKQHLIDYAVTIMKHDGIWS